MTTASEPAVAPVPEPADPYPSLDALRTAHRDLVGANRDAEEALSDIAAIKVFLQRAQITGALLDSERDRQAAQSLLNYWSTRLYRAGHEPPDAILADFDSALAPELPDAACPYCGLDSFRENNQHFYFGRKHLGDQLLEHLRHDNLLAVLGASGSGKSSLVRAGLIPALKEGALPESDRWRYYEPMVPGSNPLLNLARILKPPKADESYVAQSGPLAIINPQHFAQAVASQTTSRAVIVVDQFEEIFTLCDEDRIRQAFSANLLNLLDADHVIILTMRADFEARVALLPELQPRFERAVQRVTPLSAAELREAIVAPAEIIGLKFEDGVVEALVQDILGEPAGLPLLQFTLLKLWEQRDHNRITWEAYQRSGGGRRALARAADEFFEHLIPEEQDTAKRILLKLVRPGEGLEVTSNRVWVKDLYHKAEASDRIDRVLARLIQARLVRWTEGDTDAEDQVEVAHEALVRNWPRLVNWLEEERNELRLRQRLTSAAEQWRQGGKDPGALLRGRLLEESLRYDDLTELETEYVLTSVQAEEDEREAKQQAEQQALKAKMAEQMAELERQKARAQAQKTEIAERFAQEQQRTARVFQVQLWVSRALFGIALLALAAAVYLGWQAFTAEQEARLQATTAQNAQVTAEFNRQRAEAAAASAAYQQGQAEAEKKRAEAASAEAQADRDRAFARQLASEASNLADERPDLALLLGVASTQITTTLDSQRSLLQALSSARPIPFALGNLESAHAQPVQNVAFSLDSQTLASADTDGTLVFWDVGQRAMAGPPVETGRPIYALAFSPADATELITGGCQLLPSGECGLGEVRFWDSATRRPLGEPITSTLEVNHIALSPDGRYAAWPACPPNTDLDECSQTAVQIWDVEKRQHVQTYTGHPAYVYSTAFSRDSQLIASLSCAKFTDESSCPFAEVHVWEALTGQLKQRISAGVDSEPYAIALSPKHDALAVGYQNGMIVLWRDWATPTISQTLTGRGGHAAWIDSLAFSPDGQTLASSSDDQTIQFWNVETGQPQLDPPLQAHTHWVWSVAFSPDGQALASGGEDHAVVLWSLGENRLGAEPLRGHNGPITGLALMGQTPLLSAAGDSLRRWDLNAQPATSEIFRATVPINVPFDGKSLVFTPDGRQIVAGGQDGVINVWDARTLRSEGDPIIAHSGTVWALAFSPDGATLASGSDSDNKVQLWDFATRKPLTRLVGDAADIYSLAFSPDGKVIAGGTLDARIFIWEVQSGRLLRTLPAGVCCVASLSFSPDGRWLAAGGDPIGGATENLYLWRTEGYQRLGALTGHPGWVGAVAFHPDASNPLLVSGGDDGAIRLWDPATLRLRGQLNVEGGSSVRSLAFSPDGARLVSGTFDGSIQVWDVASRSALSTFSGHENVVWAVDFRPDGQALASVSADQTIRVWDPASSTEIGSLEPVQNQGVHQIAELALSEDGSLLATAGAEGVLVMWDLQDSSLPNQVLGYFTETVSSLAFTPDGQSLAALYFAFDDASQMVLDSNQMQIWDLAATTPMSRTISVEAITITAQSLAVHPKTGDLAVGLYDGSIARVDLTTSAVVTSEQKISQNALAALAYSPDGIWLASGDVRGEVIVQNTETGFRRPLRSHSTEVRALAFGRFGNGWVLAASSESHIAVWDAVTGQLIADFPYERVEHLAFTPNGETLLAGDADGKISILSVGVEASRARACSLAGRNLTWQEWKTYISESGREYPVVCPRNPVDYANLALGALADARTNERLGNREQARAELDQAVAYASPAVEAVIRLNNLSANQTLCTAFAEEPALAALARPACQRAVELALQQDNATVLNEICGEQSVRRMADIALPACERAVALAEAGNAEYPDAFYRETRGLTYGVLGELEKSLADLKAFVAWAIASEQYLEAVPERERWIESLESGQSPFDDETLQAVIDDY